MAAFSLVKAELFSSSRKIALELIQELRPGDLLGLDRGYPGYQGDVTGWRGNLAREDGLKAYFEAVDQERPVVDSAPWPGRIDFQPEPGAPFTLQD